METKSRQEPFPHWIIQDFVPRFMLGGLATKIPPANHPSWVSYDNDCEKGKWSLPAIYSGALDESWVQLFFHLVSPQVVDYLRALTGIDDLLVDEHWHGAGLHLTLPGGYLQPHLDYALHPNGLERRVSLVLHVQEGWEQSWGGATTMCDTRGVVVERVYPVFNSALVWCNEEHSFHGVETVSPNAHCRITAACYYLTKARPSATRRRALFVPRRYS